LVTGGLAPKPPSTMEGAEGIAAAMIGPTAFLATDCFLAAGAAFFAALTAAFFAGAFFAACFFAGCFLAAGLTAFTAAFLATFFAAFFAVTLVPLFWDDAVLWMACLDSGSTVLLTVLSTVLGEDLRTAMVFFARADFSSASTSAPVRLRADLRRRSMS